MAYKVPTTQDLANAAMKTTTKPVTSNTYNSTISQDEEQAMLDRINAYNNAHKNEPSGGGMWGPDAIRPNGYKYTGVTSSYDPYKALFEAQFAAKQKALQKQRDSMLVSLDGEKTALTNDMYNRRNSVAAKSDISQLNFAQYMGSKNVAGSAGAMPKIYADSAYHSKIGAIDRQEAAENARIASARTQVNEAYENDLVAARNQMESDLLAATINQVNANKITALEQSRNNTTSNMANSNTAYSSLQGTSNQYTNTQKTAGARIKTKQSELINNAIQAYGQVGYLSQEMQQLLRTYGIPTDIINLKKIQSQNNGSAYMY